MVNLLKYARRVSQQERMLWLLLLFGLILRVLIAPYGIHAWDFSLWTQWGDQLWVHGFADFFSESWNDRLPGGILYLLWLLAGVTREVTGLSAEVIYKLPANLADTLIAYLLFRVVKRERGADVGLMVALLYAFNPFTWYVSALWGQMDAVQAVVVVLALLSLLRGKVKLSVVLLVYGVLFKPHTIVVAPLWLVYAWHNSSDYRNWWRQVGLMALIGILITWLLVLPFAKSLVDSNRPVTLVSGPAKLLIDSWTTAQDKYQYATVNGFNMWMAIDQNYQADDALFLGASYRSLGTGIFGLLSGLLLWRLARRRAAPADYFLTAAMLFLLAFTFLTRAHERHLYPWFALWAFGMLRVKRGVILYVVLSLIALAGSVWAFKLSGSPGSITGFRPAVLALILVVAVNYLWWQIVLRRS